MDWWAILSTALTDFDRPRKIYDGAGSDTKRNGGPSQPGRGGKK